MFKFLVVSDIHFVPAGELSHSVDTTARFREAVAHIREFNRDAEFCVIAGDLTDRGETESYERLAAELEGFELPCYITLGNHDDRVNFGEVFGNMTHADTGKFDHCIDAHGQRIVVLDSVSDGEHPGQLSNPQLTWLGGVLGEARDRPAVVVLHHNISDLMVSTDGIGLRNYDMLVDVLSGHPDLRHVISGHVHLNSSGTIRGIPFTTFAGCHYNIAPRRFDANRRAPRFDGPGQYAVVWSGEESTVVLLEDFFHRQVLLSDEHF